MSARFWMTWAWRFKGPLALVAVLTLLASMTTLAIPWLAGQLLSGLVEGEAERVSVELTVVPLIAALVAMTGLTIAAGIVSESVSARILTALRQEIHGHVQRLPIRFHESSRRGDVLALTSYEVGNLSEFLAGTIANTPGMILTAVGATVILFALDPAVAWIVPVMVPAFYVAVRLAGRRLRRMSADLRAAEVELIALAERDLDMLPATKSFAVEDHVSRRFAGAAEVSRDLAIRQARLNAVVGPLLALMASLAAIAVLIIGGERLSERAGDPGELFAFLLYAALLTRPVGSLASMYGAYQIARGTLARLEGVMALRTEPGYEAPERIEHMRGAIRFENVRFAYPHRAPVFTDLNLTIEAGQIVALTGPNGVGKSTIAGLLLRYHEPDAGTITLDDVDIATIQVQALRRQFGFVPQRALLFNGSVADNIAYGCSDAAFEAIERAARAAQAADFIASLPGGYDTTIGDAGVRLSGGQRQRIALARALFHDPPIVILDEATSMYDQTSEAAFVESCVENLAGRTVIIITHRPASLALATRILELGEDGGMNEV